MVAVLHHLADLLLFLAQSPPDRSVFVQGDDQPVRVAGRVPGPQFERFVEGEGEPACEFSGQEELPFGYYGEGRVAQVVPSHFVIQLRRGPGRIAPGAQHAQLQRLVLVGVVF